MATKRTKRIVPKLGQFVELQCGIYALRANIYVTLERDKTLTVPFTGKIGGMSRAVRHEYLNVKRIISLKTFQKRYPSYKPIKVYDNVAGYRVTRVGDKFVFGCGAVKVSVADATAYLDTEETVQKLTKQIAATQKKLDEMRLKVHDAANNRMYRAIRLAIYQEASSTHLETVERNVRKIRTNLLGR